MPNKIIFWWHTTQTVIINVNSTYIQRNDENFHKNMWIPNTFKITITFQQYLMVDQRWPAQSKIYKIMVLWFLKYVWVFLWQGRFIESKQISRTFQFPGQDTKLVEKLYKEDIGSTKVEFTQHSKPCEYAWSVIFHTRVRCQIDGDYWPKFSTGLFMFDNHRKGFGPPLSCESYKNEPRIEHNILTAKWLIFELLLLRGLLDSPGSS